MDSLDHFVKDTIEKQLNNIQLNDVELFIIKICNNHTDINIVMNEIKTQLTNTNKYIIRLTFTDGNCIHVFSDLLVKIDYFKNMMECCDDCDKYYIDIIMHKCIDDYEFIKNIITYITHGVVVVSKNSHNIYKILTMLDFLGPIVYLGKNLIRYVIGNIKNYEHKGMTHNELNEMYIILQNNKIGNIDCKIFINKILDHIGYIDDVDKLFDSIVFKEIICKQHYGQELIIKHKKVIYYKELNNNNIFKIILEQFINDSNIDTWQIIQTILENKHFLEFTNYLHININIIPESIFNFNFKVFHEEIQLKLIIKHNKFEHIDYIGNLIVKSNNVCLQDLLFGYLLIGKDKNVKINNFYDAISLPNTYISPLTSFTQILSYKPIKIKNWSRIGYVNDICYDNQNNIKYIGVNINFWNNYVVDENTTLLINKVVNKPYNIIDMKHVNIYQDKNIIKVINTKTPGNHNYEFQMNSYVNIDIHIGDYVYIQSIHKNNEI